MEKIKKYTIITVIVLFIFFAGVISGIVAVSRYLETEDAKVASEETMGPWGVPRLEDENTPEITRSPEETYPKAPETTKSPEEAPSKNISDPRRLAVKETEPMKPPKDTERALEPKQMETESSLQASSSLFSVGTIIRLIIIGVIATAILLLRRQKEG